MLDDNIICSFCGFEDCLCEEENYGEDIKEGLILMQNYNKTCLLTNIIYFY